MCSPRPNWGPALKENRTGRYAEPSVIYQVNGSEQKGGVANIAYTNTDETEKVGGTKSPYPPINVEYGTENNGFVADSSGPTTKF